MTITCNKETAGMQDEIWHQFGIQNYDGNVLSVYSVQATSVLEDLFYGQNTCGVVIRLNVFEIIDSRTNVDIKLAWLNSFLKSSRYCLL